VAAVRLGEHTISTAVDCNDEGDTCNGPSDVIEVEVTDITVHDDYRKSSRHNHHDIALLRLKNKVKFTRFICPICLPLNSALQNKDYTGHSFDVAGWGEDI
jgi:Trypsin